MRNINYIIDSISSAGKFYKKVKKKDKKTLETNSELQRIFEEIKKDNIDETIILQIQEKWNNIEDIIDYFNNIPLESVNRHKHFFLYNVYNIISQLKFIAKGDVLTEIDDKGKEYIESYIKSGFCVFEDEGVKNIMLNNLSPIFDRLDDVCKTNYEEAPGCIRNNFLRSDYTPIRNQRFLFYLLDDELQSISKFLYDTNIGDVMKKYNKSNISVENVRVWRYSPVKKTDDGTVGPHVDKIAPGTFKILIYKGDIGENDGCLEILSRKNENKVVAKLTGRNPFAWVNVSFLPHRAKSPVKPRDTIELTIGPSLHDRIECVDGGSKSGNPLNPFVSWFEKI